MNPIVISGMSVCVCVCVCANHVCLGALVVANMGQECAVHVRSHHDRHSGAEPKALVRSKNTTWTSLPSALTAWIRGQIMLLQTSRNSWESCFLHRYIYQTFCHQIGDQPPCYHAKEYLSFHIKKTSNGPIVMAFFSFGMKIPPARHHILSSFLTNSIYFHAIIKDDLAQAIQADSMGLLLVCSSVAYLGASTWLYCNRCGCYRLLAPSSPSGIYFLLPAVFQAITWSIPCC